MLICRRTLKITDDNKMDIRRGDMKKRKCVECSDPVRQVGKHLCYVCYEKALRDLLRSDDAREMREMRQNVKNS